MARALLDTSVIVDWGEPEVADAVPEEVAVSTITLAELSIGPQFARDALERGKRQAAAQLAESTFEPLDFDVHAARSYGMVVAAVTVAGRSHRGRFADLLIAAVAHANGLALYTRNPRDFAGLDDLVEVVAI